MNAAEPHLAALGDDQRRALEAWLVDFDESWDENRLDLWARKLPPSGNPLRQPALIEMVKIDQERQWQRGKRIPLESYLKAFPELGAPDDVPLDLILAECDVRRQLGAPVKPDDLAIRFPHRVEDLRPYLEQAGIAAPVAKGAILPSAQSAVSATERQAEKRTAGPPSITPSQSGASAEMAIPEAFGRYRVIRKLGQGGMGAVFLAHDSQLDRPVALKVPSLRAGDDFTDLERFYREARAAATLQHPNICPIHDVGEIDGMPYLTMAYVEGKPLDEFINPEKPLPQRQVAALVRKLALTLQEAHSRGIIHRDLKPGNIMINQRREPIVMDFGLAKRVVAAGDLPRDAASPRLTHSGVLLGTPAYMPPEQVAEDLASLGPASDVYSLGVILYELLTGNLPFQGPVAVILGQILFSEPPPPSKFRSDLDGQLERICVKAMAKKVADRYGSMSDFAAALAEYLRGSGPGTASVPHESRPPGATTPLAAPEPLADLQELSVPGSAKPLPAMHSPKVSGRRLPALWAWAAAGLLLCALVAGSVALTLRSKEGTLVVNLTESDVEIFVDNGRQTVTINSDRTGRIELAPGEHQLIVRRGDEDLYTQTFTIKRGGKEIINATWIPAKAAKPSAPLPVTGKKADPIKEQLVEAGIRDLAKEILAAKPWELPNYWNKLSASKGSLAVYLERELVAKGPSAKDDLTVQRLANAAAALARMGKAEPVLPLLLRQDCPKLRAYLLDRLSALSALPDPLRQRLEAETAWGLEFDGRTSHVNTHWSYHGNSPVTLEATITPMNRNGGTTVGDIQQGGIGLAGHRAWSFLVWAGNGYKQVFANQPNVLGQADHVAGVYDRSRRQIALYVNGKRQNTVELAGKFKRSPFPIMIGADPSYYRGRPKGEPEHLFHGIIREVRLTRRALYDTDFTPPKRLAPVPDTVALYHFDEGQGNVAYDVSGNNRHADIKGARWIKVKK